MHIPVVSGVIKRRLLVNFRADPEAVARILPAPFRPKLQAGHAIVGICLIRLENIRPAHLPALLGLSSENAAHRIAVEWTDAAGKQAEGVFIPRRDTDSILNRVAGGRFFPGEHHGASFKVVDAERKIDFSMHSKDGEVSVRIVAEETDQFPGTSCFPSLEEASRFFEGGSLGYSATKDKERLDGLRLLTNDWRVGSLAVREVISSYFSNDTRFPKGTIAFDHALIMRDIPHEWHYAPDPWTSALMKPATKQPSSVSGTSAD